MKSGFMSLIWIFAIFFLLPCAADASTGPTILYFNSYHHGYAWSDRVTDGIRETLAAEMPSAELQIEYLDTKRRGSLQDFKRLRQYCFAKFAGFRPDLIMVSDNNGLDFLLDIRKELFPGIPVVFCGINFFSPAMLAGYSGVTGIREVLSVEATVELGLRLFPDTERFVLVSDRTTTGRFIRRQVEEAFFWRSYDVPLEVVDDVTSQELVARLAEYDERTITLMGNFFVDSAGTSLDLGESLQLVSAAARGPVLTFWRPFMAPGILGGALISAFGQGRAAALAAVDILRGRDVDSIAVSDGPENVLTLDYHEALRWNCLRGSGLPGLRVINRPPSFYALNKGLVRGVLVFGLALGVVAIVVLIINLRLRKAEAALRESERNYREIFNSTGDAVIIHDAGTGMLTDANETTLNMFGVARDHVQDLKLQDLLAGEEPSTVADIEAAVIAASRGGEVILEARSRRVDNGREFWTETVLRGTEIGGMGRVLAVVRDISRRKRNERERTLLAKAVEEAPVIIMITDPEPRIQYVNRAFSRITGYSEQEVVGKNPSILKSGRHDRSFYEGMWSTMLSGQTWRGRIVNRRKDGSEYTEEASVSAMHDSAGSIVNYLAVKQDISREIALEESLLQAQKMEAVGKLAGGVAHDFNNLLQVISGYTDLAMQQMSGSRPEFRYLQDVLKASERAADLVRQLLTFSRKTPLKNEEFSLNELVEGMLKMIRRVIGEQYDPVFYPGSLSGTVMGDPGQIEQVLMNLCVNARDAMSGGGSLTIRTDQAEVARRGTERASYMTLSVSDTGTGIPEEIIDHIFEPFFTSKEVGKGTGLGLATVYAIAERHDGFVEVDTKEGSGTTFTVYLPVSKQSPGEGERRDEQEEAGSGSGEMILVAEDDDLVLDLAETILEEAGYEVVSARDGNEAVELFEKLCDRIDLVLLDVVMPGKNGRAVFDDIQTRMPEIPVVFATGYEASVLDGISLSDRDRVALIRKPYLPDELLRVVRQALGREEKGR